MAKDKAYMLRMETRDFIRWSAFAARNGQAFSEFCRAAMDDRVRRLSGETPTKLLPEPEVRVPSGPAPQVRLPEAAKTTGVGRVGEVVSSEAQVQRDRARDLARRQGRCTADVTRGMRCKLCGEVHR